MKKKKDMELGFLDYILMIDCDTAEISEKLISSIDEMLKNSKYAKDYKEESIEIHSFKDIYQVLSNPYQIHLTIFDDVKEEFEVMDFVNKFSTNEGVIRIFKWDPVLSGSICDPDMDMCSIYYEREGENNGFEENN